LKKRKNREIVRRDRDKTKRKGRKNIRRGRIEVKKKKPQKGN